MLLIVVGLMMIMSGRCKNKNNSSGNTPPSPNGPTKNVKIVLKYQDFNSSDNPTGKFGSKFGLTPECQVAYNQPMDIYLRIYYFDNQGNEIEYSLTMLPNPPGFMLTQNNDWEINAELPETGEYFIDLITRMPYCSDCCGNTYILNNQIVGVNGCSNSPPNFTEEGKFEMIMSSSLIIPPLGTHIDNLMYDQANCICDCF